MRPPRVVVSLSTYRCTSYLRAAVDSILAQTYRDFALVVVNDGDPDEDFATLADIRDPRLVRFATRANHGCFFQHEVVLRAFASSEYIAIQDADDVSTPHRLERLIAAIDGTRIVGAASRIGGAYGGSSHNRDQRAMSRRFTHRYCHAALWRTDALRTIGGYYGGYRLGWDSLLTNALALYGEMIARPGDDPVAWVDEELYIVNARPESLTRDPLTCKGSEARNACATVYREMWKGMYARRGKLDLPDAIRNRMISHLTVEHETALDCEAQRLRSVRA